MASTLRTVGTGVAWNTVAGIVVKVLALVNVILVLSHLSVYDYGLVQLVFTVVSTIGVLLLPGLVTVLISDIARERGRGNIEEGVALARQFIVLQFLLGILAFLILFFGSELVAVYLHKSTIGFYLQIASFAFLAGAVRTPLSLLVSVELRFVFQSILFILDEGVKLLLLIFFFWLELGPAAVLYSMALAPFLVVLMTLPWSISSFRPLFRARAAQEPWWALLTGHRFWGLASSYLTTLNQNARLWIVQLFLGTEAVGLFSFAQGLVSQASALVTFSSITSPVLAKATHTPGRLAAYASRALKYQLWVALIAVIPGAIITPFFISKFFHAYEGATTMTLIGLSMVLLSAVNVPITGVYAALKQQRDYFFRATLTRSCVILIILIPLISLCGLTGVMIEFVITNLVAVYGRMRSVQRMLPGFDYTLKSLTTFDPTDRELLKRVRLSMAGLIKRGIIRPNV